MTFAGLPRPFRCCVLIDDRSPHELLRTSTVGAVVENVGTAIALRAGQFLALELR